MSVKKTNLATIVNDFLDNRLSGSDRRAFIELYSGLAKEDREEAGLIFDEIQSQVDGLSDSDFQRFLLRLDAERNKGAYQRTTIFQKFVPYVGYAAAIALVVGIVTIYTTFLNKNGELIRYSAAQDELLWLPDSSRVFLKAGSELSYQPTYGTKGRLVELDGDAFFDVKPDKSKSFTVRSKTGFFTRVLGTSFFMRTQANSERVEVKTGRVQVGRGQETFSVLAAGDTLYLKENVVIVNRNRRAHEPELLQFDNETLKRVTAVLANEFGRKIVLDSSVPEGLMYTATFSTDQEFADILKVLCELHGLSYSIETDTITIYKELMIKSKPNAS